MKKILKKLSLWLRDLILDNVDKEFEGPLPYHKEFGSKKNPVERIEKEFNEQKRRNKPTSY